MYFFPSRAAGVTILALVYVNSQLEHAGVYKEKVLHSEVESGLVFFWKREKEALGVIWVVLVWFSIA